MADCAEPNLDRVLVVGHSLRLAAATVWRGETQKAEEALILQMIGIVVHLFPHRSKDELLKGVKKLVKKALSVKEHISEEKALYYCNWESGGKAFEPERMEPSGEKRQGKVAFCTFPGLIRIELEVNTKTVHVVVRCGVLLQADIS